MCLRMEWASSGVAIIVSRTRRSVLQAQSIVRHAASRSRDPHIFHYAAMGPGSAAPLTRCAASGARDNQEKNMRAAEAMVSSAPNPMKIFPIKEV